MAALSSLVSSLSSTSLSSTLSHSRRNRDGVRQAPSWELHCTIKDLSCECTSPIRRRISSAVECFSSGQNSVLTAGTRLQSNLPRRISHPASAKPFKFSERPFKGSRLSILYPSLPTRQSSCSPCKAADAADAATPAPESASSDSSLIETIRLGALFGLWYLFNIYFNIYNKQVLKVFPYPLTCTTLQFGIGAVLVLLMWGTGIHKAPTISLAQIRTILPLALVHTLGNLFTNVSLGKVAVSFTHTIKAMEPFFSVVLSAMFLNERPEGAVILTLLPIVAGVALASATEASFNWAGFLSAMGSNLTFQSRNVLSKKFMIKKEGSLDNINLFSVITILSLCILLVPTLVIDGIKFTPAHLNAAGLNVNEVLVRAVIAAACFHSYQQVSYMILQRVSPVSHSVGNCVKRVVVIVTSVLFFRTPVSLLNGVGTSIALAGVFSYARLKAKKSKKSA